MYQVGDIIEVNKGLFRHPGVYMGYNRVFHNYPPSGEAIVDLATYDPNGSGILYLRPHSSQVPAIISRIEQMMQNPQSYSPFSNNCEDSVSKALTGKGGSPQRGQWTWVAVFTIGATLLTR